MEDIWKIICSGKKPQTQNDSDDHLLGRTQSQ
jgi:hypothetical protein